MALRSCLRHSTLSTDGPVLEPTYLLLKPKLGHRRILSGEAKDTEWIERCAGDLGLLRRIANPGC